MQVLEACRVLGVRLNVDAAELKQCYHRLVKLYHPDAGGDTADRNRLEQVVEAYRILSERTATVVKFPQRNGTRSNRRPTARDGAAAPAAGRERPSTRRRQATTRDEAKAQRRQGTDVSPSELAALGHLVIHSRNAATRAFSARRLGNSGKRSSYAFLRRALYDPNPLVVKSAVRAIGALNVVQGAGELGSVFCRGDTELKHLVLDIVERSDVRFRDTIMVGLRDEDASVRRRCLSLYARASASRQRQHETERQPQRQAGGGR